MSDFFNAFWPNLASTLVGVAVGVPIALYLNRQLTSQSLAHEASERTALLLGAISVLIESCDYNIRVLKNVATLSLDGEIMRNPDLRTTTWETLSGIATTHLNDPELLQITSHHWLRLKRLEELNSHVFAMQIGQLALPQEPVTLESYIFELHATATDLATHASEISSRLRLVGNGVAPNNSFKPKPLRGSA